MRVGISLIPVAPNPFMSQPWLRRNVAASRLLVFNCLCARGPRRRRSQEAPARGLLASPLKRLHDKWCCWTSRAAVAALLASPLKRLHDKWCCWASRAAVAALLASPLKRLHDKWCLFLWRQRHPCHQRAGKHMHRTKFQNGYATNSN